MVGGEVADSVFESVELRVRDLGRAVVVQVAVVPDLRRECFDRFGRLRFLGHDSRQSTVDTRPYGVNYFGADEAEAANGSRHPCLARAARAAQGARVQR